MTISDALMTALFAFDTYNRGPEAQLNNASWSGLGTATYGIGSEDQWNAQYGFYAQSYHWNGETVIAYRGTDNFAQDALYGYGLAIGQPHVLPQFQGALALDFYRQVLGLTPDDDPRVSDVLLTGHSLGGGLAGYVAALYQRHALLFDNMQFQDAAANVYAISSDQDPDFPDVAEYLRTTTYGNLTPWAPSYDYMVNIYVPADGIQTNLLAFSRDVTGPGQTLNEVAFDLPPDTPLGWTRENMVGQRHDGSFLIIRLFADEYGAGPHWREAAKYFIPALFQKDIADAINANEFLGVHNDVTGVMRGAIAYSAIDEGTMPFGDAAIRALFNDVTQLGRLYEEEPANAVLRNDDIAKAFSEIAVQYAGDLALQKSEDDAAKKGTIAFFNDPGLMLIEFDPAKWPRTTDNGNDIVGRDHLIEAIAQAADVPIERWEGQPENVTRFLAALDNDAVAMSASGAPTSASGDPGGVILVGGGGSDTIEGGDGEDVLVGGDGDDLMRSGDRNDLVIGGEGDDTFVMEAGDNETGIGDIYVGGEGADVYVLARMTEAGGHKLEYTIGDASSEDRLFAAYNFFNGSGGGWEGSALLPLLGGIKDFNYNVDENRYESPFVWQRDSDLPPVHYGPGSYYDDMTQGIIEFRGYISYQLVGSELTIRLYQGDWVEDTVTYTDWHADSWTVTSKVNVYFPETETIIHVLDFNEGDLGIHFYEPGDADYGGDRPIWPAVEAVIPTLTNNGAMDPALPDFDPVPALDLKDDDEDTPDGSPITIPISVPPENSGNTPWEGTPGDDAVKFYGSDDTIDMLGGDDYVDPGAGSDQVDGGAGQDTVSFESASASVTVSLLAGSSSEGDTLLNFENLIGSASDDTLEGTEGANKIYGRAGDDVISGLGGSDVLKGESGNDTIEGGVGNDVIDGGAGSDMAVYSGLRSDYQITRLSGGTIVVRDLRSVGDGADDLTNVEFVRFADGVFAEADLANRAPLSRSAITTVAERNTATTFAASTLLSGATDLDGDALTVSAVSGAAHGAVAIGTNGDIVFTPDAGFAGIARFNYTISDGAGGTAVNAVSLIVAAPQGENNTPDH